MLEPICATCDKETMHWSYDEDLQGSFSLDCVHGDLLLDDAQETALSQDRSAFPECMGDETAANPGNPKDLTIADRTGKDSLMSHDDMMILVDAALRLSLAYAPRKLSAGITITRVEGFKRLVDIAPHLFSPGQLPVLCDIGMQGCHD